MDKDGTTESKEPADSPVKIKEEPRDDIKDFAETTMNELLGWYGYDKVDSQDTEHLNLNRFAGQDSDCEDDDDDDLDDDSCGSRTPCPPDLMRDSLSRDSLDSNSGLTPGSPGSSSDLAAQHQALVTALNSSQSSKSPTGTPTEGGTPQPGSYIVCAWCQKPGVKHFTLKSTERGSKAFCSELCFTQCRRASFKKNKVCDWCKHVRHTVNYVDFQDGEQQLQFCSDKCLNQYKMNIFCKETQEHLQQIQSQMDTGTLPSPASANQILITPDLWMQNGKRCRSKDRNEKPEQEKPLNLQKTEEDKKDETIKAAITAKREREREGETEGLQGELNGDGYSVEKRFKIDKERLRRIRARESSSTPLSVTTSPGSSQLSTPASSSCNLTPPMGNGPTFTQALAGNPLLGALGPGALAQQPLLFHSLFGGAMPGVMPPGMLLAPEHQRPPGSSLRVSPAPESGTCSGRPISHPGNGQTGRSSTPKPSPPIAHSLPAPRLPLPGLPPMPPMNPFHPGFPLHAPPPGLLGGNPLASLMPPATTLVPYPVLLPFFFPLPVPIPIPIPFPADGKLPSPNKKESTSKPDPVKSEIKVKVTSSEGKVTCAESATPSRDSECKQAQRIQCACCQSETVPEGECNSSIRQSAQNGEVDDHEPVRLVIKTPVTDSECSVITSSSDIEDVVIDLSTDKSGSPNKDPPMSMISAVDQNKNSTVLRVAHLAAPHDPHTTTNSLIGGLHTVTGAPLPPPQNHAYSSRRALLLDAPSVPRDRNRSPSPDRRLLLRNPTRDMLFGKRRCMRTRIKTK